MLKANKRDMLEASNILDANRRLCWKLMQEDARSSVS